MSVVVKGKKRDTKHKGGGRRSLNKFLLNIHTPLEYVHFIQNRYPSICLNCVCVCVFFYIMLCFFLFCQKKNHNLWKYVQTLNTFTHKCSHSLSLVVTACDVYVHVCIHNMLCECSSYLCLMVENNIKNSKQTHQKLQYGFLENVSNMISMILIFQL